MNDSALVVRGVEKRFGDLVAVRDLSITFHSHEVHALLGENGAGKSTLMSIAAGFLTPDKGEMLIDDQRVAFGSPRMALASGIGMVHQHFRLIEKFTVAENLAVGAQDVAQRFSANQLLKRARDLAEEYNFDIDATAPVWSLSEGEKQRVEILRTLSRGARILILDEPTAVLTPEEADHLCVSLRKMAAQGRTVIFISHKLNEVLQVADRISVMRHGNLLTTLERATSTVESLSRAMFEEHDFAAHHLTRLQHGGGDPVLILSDVSVRNERGIEALKEVTLEVRRGEIVGIAGVAGNGQQELEQVVTGHRRVDSGRVVIADRDIRSISQALRAGLAYIPEDRKGTGLVPGQSIWRNAILRSYRWTPIQRFGAIIRRQARGFATNLIERVDLSTSDTSALVQQLSGGNAQKLLAGRELTQDCEVVVAVNPTQGLDIKAAVAVRQALLDATERKLAILLISADLDEVLALSDRVSVLYEGRIVGTFAAKDADRERIGLLIGGASA